jgi:hypothetical protein
MTEKFLHYLWKMKLLKMDDLCTSSGERIHIISTGEQNHHAGPDFLNARIRIGKTEWAGNVEIHVKASEWNEHRHHTDGGYNNVILHVVYDNDAEVFHEDGTAVPSLQLKNHVDRGTYETYQSLMQSAAWVPCERQVAKVKAITVSQWLHRLMIDRMEQKVVPIMLSLRENRNNWEETFYQSVAAAFGAKVNAEPFRMLARALPVKILAKHKGSAFQLEALLFGTAGFLDEKFSDEYSIRLKKEFEFLRKRHGLQPMKKHVWKFLRLRPSNFPTIRLAQFARLIHTSTHLLSNIIETKDLKTVIHFFECGASDYWIDHYRFDKLSARRRKQVGKETIELILINTVAPFLFVYGKMHGDEELVTRSLRLLEQLPAEKNAIISRWRITGVAATSAVDSQALLQLKNVYCKNFRCLECAIGHQILTVRQRNRNQ